MKQPAIEELIPHRSPMCFVEEVVGRVGEDFVCRGRIPADLGVRGEASPLLGVELGAQAAGVLGALERREGAEGDGPQIGYLVSIRDASFESPGIPAGQALTVRVRKAGSMQALSKYEVTILDEEAATIYLSAVIGTFSRS